MRPIRYREISIAMLEFFSIVRGFEEVVYGHDDDGILQDAFERYERIWKEYCIRWATEDRVIRLRMDGFIDYMMTNNIDIYEY